MIIQAEGLDCSKGNATVPGHTIINCERHAHGEDFGAKFSACGTPGRNECCTVLDRMHVVQVVRRVSQHQLIVKQ